MGLLVAAFVVTEQVCDYQCEILASEITEEQDKGDEQNDEPEVVQALVQQMLPSTTTEIEPFEAIFIRELFVESEETLPFIADVPLQDSHFFKTLFRQIQSPNAP